MRIALGLQYDGTHYNGWQKQTNQISIQETVELALSTVANQEIRVYCAGRTDAGVHATGQVIHFETPIHRSSDAWLLGTNSYLPRDIRIEWVKSVPDKFHARFSAIARHYRYVIYNHFIQSAFLRNLATWEYHRLNIQWMREAAICLLGEHDFSAFRSSECQSKSPFRHIFYLDVSQREKFVVINIKANAFLHHMVRNIAGALIAIGQGKQPPNWIKKVLQARDRTQASKTASPAGLYLIQVEYPDEFSIPVFNISNDINN